MSGEVLGKGHKVEAEAGEEVLVSDSSGMLAGMPAAIERAVRVRKVAPVIAKMEGLPVLMGARPSVDSLVAKAIKPDS